jgi:hypothetical protein
LLSQLVFMLNEGFLHFWKKKLQFHTADENVQKIVLYSQKNEAN